MVGGEEAQTITGLAEAEALGRRLGRAALLPVEVVVLGEGPVLFGPVVRVWPPVGRVAGAWLWIDTGHLCLQARWDHSGLVPRFLLFRAYGGDEIAPPTGVCADVVIQPTLLTERDHAQLHRMNTFTDGLIEAGLRNVGDFAFAEWVACPVSDG